MRQQKCLSLNFMPLFHQLKKKNVLQNPMEKPPRAAAGAQGQQPPQGAEVCPRGHLDTQLTGPCWYRAH